MTDRGNHRGASQPDARAVFEIIVREHSDMLETYLRAVMGADPTLDDVFQEAMIVAWRRLGDYDRARPFGPWLRGIAHMLVLEHARKGRARPRSTDPQVFADLDTRFEGLSRLTGDTFREKADVLWKCMAKLPDTMREAVDLVYVRGVGLTAAAESLGTGREAPAQQAQSS